MSTDSDEARGGVGRLKNQNPFPLRSKGFEENLSKKKYQKPLLGKGELLIFAPFRLYEF